MCVIRKSVERAAAYDFITETLNRLGYAQLSRADKGVMRQFLVKMTGLSQAQNRRQMVELVRAGRTPGELAREFECSASAIRNWVHQADRDEGRREDGLTTAEREELRRLRPENRQLREEREILKKAAAWFARETGTVPGRSSSS